MLPGFVTPERSKELHVALVVHGRQICKPRTPHCDDCSISDLCATGRKGTYQRMSRGANVG
jgi:endonuclease-3